MANLKRKSGFGFYERSGSSEGVLWELKPKSTCNLATVSGIIGRGEQIKIDETLKWLFGVQGIDKYPNFKNLSSRPGQTRAAASVNS